MQARRIVAPILIVVEITPGSAVGAEKHFSEKRGASCKRAQGVEKDKTSG